jgi:hypothetical protein
MKINAIFDASAANAPAGFETAVQAAISYLESAIATPITVTIQFGWGEIAGQAMQAGALGESLPYGSFLTYSQVKSALAGVARDADETTSVGTLGATDPTGGGEFFVATAEQKALGLIPASLDNIDGYVGLDATQAYSFDPNNRGVAGEWDAIGILEHEITEVLGRDATLGLAQTNATNIYNPMDLFRYASAGVRDVAPAAANFSINGTAQLLQWNNPLNGGDGGDWSTAVPDDSFDAFATLGVPLTVSPTDLRLLDILGFQPTALAAATPPTTPTPSVGATAPVTVTSGLTVTGSQFIQFAGSPGSVTGYTLSGASASLTDSGTITVISSAAAGAVGVSGSAHAGFFQVNAGDAFYVEATAAGGSAAGFLGGAASPNVAINGLEQVVSAQSAAAGVVSGDSASSVSIGSAGTILVWGGTSAVGVDLTNGGSFSNSGLVEVSSVNATGVEGASSFNNAGTITAIGINGGAGGSIGVDITAPQSGGPVLSTLTNTGTINADVAVFLDANSFNQQTPNVTINNSGGHINGAIELANGNDTITNSGSISGNIFFGDGNTAYNGASGTLSGALYLGFGVNHVTLGNDGETVYGGFDSDTITGGSGNDVIEIGGGNNTVNGGGGFNVLSFADSPTAVSVNLATGTATDDGTDTISNFQEVIGSQGAAAGSSETLQAGSAGATLIAGSAVDTLIGGAGNDTLIASFGGGTMTGGGGANTFVVGIGDINETITDFNTGDVLNIYGFSSAQSVTQHGSSVVITLSGSQKITLQNTTVSEINSTDVTYNSALYPSQSLPSSLPPYGTNPIFIEQNLTIQSGATISEQGEPYGLVNEAHSLDIEGSVSVSFPVQLLSDQVWGWIDNNIGEFGAPITSANDSLTMGAGGSLSVSDLEGGAVGFEPLYTTSLSNAGHVTIAGGGGGWGVQAPTSVFNYTSLVGGALSVTATGAAYGLQLGEGGQIANAGAITASGTTAAYGVQIDGAAGQSLTNSGSIIASIGSGVGSSGIVIVSDDNDSDGDTGPLSASGAGAAISKAAGLPVALPNANTDDGGVTVTSVGGLPTGTGINATTTFGIAVGGSGSGAAYTINNTGTINAQTAIGTYNDGNGQLPALNIINGGAIIGAIDLEAAVSSLVNTGSITGNIVLQDDSAGSSTPGYQVDLSHGTFTGQIQISPGSVGNVAITDTIKTGAGATTIGVAAGESNLHLDVTGLASAQATIDLDIASSQATETHEANGSWLVNAGTDGAFLLTNVETLQFTDHAVHLAEGPPAADDFNGDGFSDILFGQADGTVANWLMDGTQINGGGTIGSPGGTWQEVGVGDFNGDGKGDIVFQDDTGNIAIWEMNGASIIGGGTIGNPGGTWHVSGIGDFNGAAQSDILFSDTAGDVALWEMNGTNIVGGGTLGNPGGTWAVRGVGDFNGDGKSDVLFQDGAGNVAIWEMNGTSIIGGGAIANPGAGWQVEGVGDFNADGKSDILFENTTSGEYAIWEMNGTAIIGGGNIGDPGGTWQFAGVGDFNGEGHADILFTDAAGDLAIWEMNGTQIIGGGNIGNPGSVWHVLG